MTDYANGAHAAAMGYMDSERRTSERRRRAREAYRQAREMAPEPVQSHSGGDLGHEPSDPRYHESELGMFTRPDTQSIHQAAHRDNVSDDTFKQDLTPQANSAESDRSRDYSRDNDNGGVAYSHMDLQQHDANALVNDILCRLRVNPYNFVGQGAFHNQWTGTDAPAGSPGNNVALTDFDARAQASGGMAGMEAFNDHPAVRTEYHSARLSATPPNGSHSTSGSVTSYAAPKSESKLDIMKATMRRIDVSSVDG